MEYIPAKYRLDMLEATTVCNMLCGGCKWWNDEHDKCEISYKASDIPTNILINIMNEFI